MFPVFQIGPFAIQAPGLILLLGGWLGLTLTEKHARRTEVDANHLSNGILIGLLAGVVGARFTFALKYPAAFSSNPINLVSLNPALLDWGGGVVFAFIAALIYGQRKKMKLWPTLDALTPGMAALAVAVGLMHLASGDAYGAPAELPWSIFLWGEDRHPTQIYEILAALIILILIYPGGRLAAAWKWAGSVPGINFLLFISLSAIARLVLEPIHADSDLLIGGLRSAQIAAWVLLALCLYLIDRKISLENHDLRSPDNCHIS